MLTFSPHFGVSRQQTMIPSSQAAVLLAPSEYQEVPACLLGSAQTCEPGFTEVEASLSAQLEILIHDRLIRDRQRQHSLIYRIAELEVEDNIL